MPEEQIKKDFILNKFLTPEEFTLLLDSTKENLISTQTKQEEPIIIQSQEIQTEQIKLTTKNKLNKILCVKISHELLTRLKQYSKKHGQSQSDYTRDLLTNNIK